MAKKIIRKVDIVASCYNEEKNVLLFYDACKKILKDNKNYRIIYVNDGSIDKTYENLLKLKRNADKKIKIKIINFSKNFGHEMAMLAGLDESDGDIVIFMDVDLQHPVSKIKNIISSIESGNDIVSMVRIKNKGKGLISELLSKIFYKLINIICKTTFSESASDFFAIDKKVADFLKSNYREKNRFMRGVVQNIGFNKNAIEYIADKRKYGQSKYNKKKLWKLAESTLYQYTNLPLRLGKIASFISIIFGLSVLIYTLITRQGAPSGYTTVVILISFMFSVLFFIIGMIGEYLSILLDEVRNRPGYIIDNIIE